MLRPKRDGRLVNGLGHSDTVSLTAILVATYLPDTHPRLPIEGCDQTGIISISL